MLGPNAPKPFGKNSKQQTVVWDGKNDRGRYGNVDDGKPRIAEGGPPNPRSIGGDEVALFHPCYVGTHTDRRLFIADPGNARIVSVRLDYHSSEQVHLKDAREVRR